MSQSFLEMLSSGPSRSPSPARPPTVEHDDPNNPSLTNWGYQHRQINVIDEISCLSGIFFVLNANLILGRSRRC